MCPLKSRRRSCPRATERVGSRRAGEFRRSTYAAYLGYAYFTAGRYQDAIATLIRHHALRVRRGSHSLLFLAASYISTGQGEKARAALKAFLDKKPGTTISNYSRLRLYKRAEDRDRLANLLRKAGMPE